MSWLWWPVAAFAWCVIACAAGPALGRFCGLGDRQRGGQR